MKRLFGNGNGNGKEWKKPNGNPVRMEIGRKIGNGNEKEWECEKPFPVISIHHPVINVFITCA